jgi:hypothetical protein
MGRSRKKPDYDAERVQRELVNLVTELYEGRQESKWQTKTFRVTFVV